MGGMLKSASNQINFCGMEVDIIEQVIYILNKAYGELRHDHVIVGEMLRDKFKY